MTGEHIICLLDITVFLGLELQDVFQSSKACIAV